MRKATFRPTWAPASLAVVVVLFAAGCGGQITDICERGCECEGCSDDLLDECISDGNAIEDDAKAAGCTKEFDAYSDCVDDNLVCEGTNSRVNGCVTEKQALSSCHAGAGS